MRPDQRLYRLVRRSSALEPLIKLVAITTPTALLAAYALHDQVVLAFFLLSLAAAPILSLAAAFFYFLIYDPPRLRSWKAN
ncbi:hypothetical protein Ms3S1_15190 [Methylosinus sp. 3S-1]|uniref:Uncharacterized protein n=1 Tax=Methylosinus trichosporium (strain ATCC 35070 / NCIMB 11131 / UNIQEM 75 / OB3b) TaxID=595536 RepID=A0A2D2CYH3_METT3|nr:hypothetical protein CQW49_07620 [Methylosinus trichosporium OB3b]OBS51795.1 hypothetical protein A8B73_14125 [Methylosinus sp. 3S-1]